MYNNLTKAAPKSPFINTVLSSSHLKVFTSSYQAAPLCLQDNLGAIDYLCIVAKVALLVQKEDNS